MSKLAATVLFVALAGGALALWLTSDGNHDTGAAADKTESPTSGYDYSASDVTMQQMGPDGALQYTLEAKRIAQQPQTGTILAENLVIHSAQDAGTAPHWTLSADQADLPDSGDVINLRGKVRAEVLPGSTRTTMTVNTEQISYNLKSQDLIADKPVDFTRGNMKAQCKDLRTNIKLGNFVSSACNVISAP